MEKKKLISQKTSNKKNSKLTEIEKKLKLANKKIISLEKELLEQKKLNEVNINAFQEKAKTFQNKAQLEVNKIKSDLSKKNQNEINDIKKYSSQKLLESIINPIINIEMAAQANTDNDAVKAYVQGFKMLLDQLYNEMSLFSIVKISPHVGEKFNPKFHHAISTAKGKKDIILNVKQPGLMLHDRVIKPATVVIGK